MPKGTPKPIGPIEHRARLRRVKRLALDLGFVGRVEYSHTYGSTGGAQFGVGTSISHDLLTVFVDAFERDANPDDFSLNAIIAHERGHQLVVRHPALRRATAGGISETSEEILASVLGSLVVSDHRDRDDLEMKAIGDVLTTGKGSIEAVRLVTTLRSYLEKLL